MPPVAGGSEPEERTRLASSASQPVTAAAPGRRVALVLGGGGLKGFAHVGVLRALEERGIEPSLYAGTSIGALIAAARVGGMGVDEMKRRATSLRRRDLFRLDGVGMLVDRLRSPAIYRDEPLRALVDSVIPDRTFREQRVPLFVNTVDVQSGTLAVWGTPGLRDVPVRDAVFASCALPGFFTPGKVAGRPCMDGGIVDNLPVSIAAVHADALIAVDVGNSNVAPREDVERLGFPEIYLRAASMMMHALQESPLVRWSGPPMILVRPRVSHINWFSFANTDELIEEGYRATIDALTEWDDCLNAATGVFPRHEFALAVNRPKCIGCGLCVALAPEYMAMDASGIAYARETTVDWSPANGDFVRHCPTAAIDAVAVNERAMATSQEWRAEGRG